MGGGGKIRAKKAPYSAQQMVQLSNGKNGISGREQPHEFLNPFSSCYGYTVYVRVKA